MMRGKASRWIHGIAAIVFVALSLSGCTLLQTNRSPMASFEVTPDEGYGPLEVAFDASGSADPDGDPLVYRWVFGDGTTGMGARTSHSYENAGSYDVILRVTDPDGLDDAVLSTIEVLDVPAGHVVRRFAWPWNGAQQTLEFALPLTLYQAYRGRLRTPLVDNYEYGAFVEDSLDDPTLEDVADALFERVSDDLAFAEYALAFVQGAIAYAADPPDVEWPLYPMETLVDGEGDCEDTAILYVSLLKAHEIACQLAFVDTDDDGSPDHVLVLVEVDASFAQRPGVTVFESGGRGYAVAETSSGIVPLGVDPWGIEESDLIELWPF